MMDLGIKNLSDELRLQQQKQLKESIRKDIHEIMSNFIGKKYSKESLDELKLMILSRLRPFAVSEGVELKITVTMNELDSSSVTLTANDEATYRLFKKIGL